MQTAEGGKKLAGHQWSRCIAMHLCSMEHQLGPGMSYRDFDLCAQQWSQPRTHLW